MEVNVQIDYEGFKAEYCVVSLFGNCFHASLESYGGNIDDFPPKEIIFMQDNGHTIASSDVMTVAQALVTEINAFNGSTFRFQQGG